MKYNTALFQAEEIARILKENKAKSLEEEKNNLIKLKVDQVENYVNQIEKQAEKQLQNLSTTELLKKIVENQEIDRKRYERNNPVENDEPVYDWAEATIEPGEMVQFIFEIPEGRTFYFEYPNITYNVDTTYYIWIDGVYQPILSDVLQDFGDHLQVYKPPKFCYAKVEVWALNNGVIDQTYSCFFRGFLRWYRAIHREVTYESIKEEEKL